MRRGTKLNTNIKRRKIISILIIAAMALALVALSATASHAASKGTYWLKINKQRNVITAYKKVSGKWKPVRAMLCTTGAVGTPTPSGTFYGGYKARWLNMIGEDGGSTFEQYTMLVNSSTQIYIHSVWYYSRSHSAQSSYEFNKLGHRGSHGCIRTSTMDAKWIYDNCRVGTKITIYRSSKSGPLGKPKALHSSSGWDPTDPVKGNPHFHMRKPVIKISSHKAKTVQYGKSYNLKSKVTVKDPNALMNITSRLKVKAVYKWNSSSRKWAKASFSTKKLGTYKIRYYVNDPYSTKASRTFKVRVVDSAKPAIKGAVSKTVTSGYVSAVKGVTASQPSASRTGAIKVTITSPDSKVSVLTYAEAKTYVFDQVGKYKVTYTVANKYDSSKATSKTVHITVADETVPVISGAADRNVAYDTTASAFAKDATAGVTATQGATDVTSAMKVTITAPDKTSATLTYEAAKAYEFKENGAYTVTFTIVNRQITTLSDTKTITITSTGVPS